jgi:hypothetical protein
MSELSAVFAAFAFGLAFVGGPEEIGSSSSRFSSSGAAAGADNAGVTLTGGGGMLRTGCPRVQSAIMPLREIRGY